VKSGKGRSFRGGEELGEVDAEEMQESVEEEEEEDRAGGGRGEFEREFALIVPFLSIPFPS